MGGRGASRPPAPLRPCAPARLGWLVRWSFTRHRIVLDVPRPTPPPTPHNTRNLRPQAIAEGFNKRQKDVDDTFGGGAVGGGAASADGGDGGAGGGGDDGGGAAKVVVDMEPLHSSLPELRGVHASLGQLRPPHTLPSTDLPQVPTPPSTLRGGGAAVPRKVFGSRRPQEHGLGAGPRQQRC